MARTSCDPEFRCIVCYLSYIEYRTYCWDPRHFESTSLLHLSQQTPSGVNPAPNPLFLLIYRPNGTTQPVLHLVLSTWIRQHCALLSLLSHSPFQLVFYYIDSALSTYRSTTQLYIKLRRTCTIIQIRNVSESHASDLKSWVTEYVIKETPECALLAAASDS